MAVAPTIIISCVRLVVVKAASNPIGASTWPASDIRFGVWPSAEWFPLLGYTARGGIQRRWILVAAVFIPPRGALSEKIRGPRAWIGQYCEIETKSPGPEWSEFKYILRP